MTVPNTRVVNDSGHTADHNTLVDMINARITSTAAATEFVSRTGNVGFFGVVPIARALALTAASALGFTAAPAAAPAGGAGAAAGGWDTAANRDAAIATINATRTRVAELETVVSNLRTRLNELETRVLRGYGLLP